MTKKDVAEEVEAIEEVVETPKERSDAYKAFKKHLANYKEQNPVKYAIKEEALLAKLNSL